MRKVSRIESMVKKYEHLVVHYAKSIMLNRDLGLEIEDIEQELRIKLYTSLASYGKKWKKYKETGENRPMDVSVFLKSALKNKVTDIIRSLNAQKNWHEEFVGITEVDFAFHTNATSEISFEENEEKIVINGIDILINLRGDKRKAYLLYIGGYTARELQKIFTNIDIEEMINRQRLRLEESKNVLLDLNEQTIIIKNQNEDQLCQKM